MSSMPVLQDFLFSDTIISNLSEVVVPVVVNAEKTSDGVSCNNVDLPVLTTIDLDTFLEYNELPKLMKDCEVVLSRIEDETTFPTTAAVTETNPVTPIFPATSAPIGVNQDNQIFPSTAIETNPPTISREKKVVKRRSTVDNCFSHKKKKNSVESITISIPHSSGTYEVKSKKVSLHSFTPFQEMANRAKCIKRRIKSSEEVVKKCEAMDPEIQQKINATREIHEEIVALKVKIAQLRKKSETMKGEIDRDSAVKQKQLSRAEREIKADKDSLNEIKSLFRTWSKEMESCFV